MAFTLSSSSFAAGATIPVKHTCDGADRSPPLRWDDSPQAQSFVLIMDDPDAPGGIFTHWVLYDIPGTQRALPDGLAPVSALGTSGINDFARMGYGGPCPPRGSAHRYVFTLAALDIATLRVAPGAARRAVEDAMRSHAVGQAQLMGRYTRT